MGNPQTDESEQARSTPVFSLELQGKKGDGAWSPVKNRTLYFPVGLASYTLTEPARNEAHQTLAGQYVELWGPGFKQLAIEGHTGFGTNVAIEGLDAEHEMDGYQAFVRLRAIYRDYLDATKANLYAKPDQMTAYRLVFRSWEEGEHWEVVPSGADAFRRQRNEQKPMLFPFSLHLVGVQDLNHDGKLGNLLAPFDLAGALAGLGVTGGALVALANNPWFTAGSNAVKSFAASVAAVGKQINDAVKLVKSVATVTAKALQPLADAARACRNLMRAVVGLVGLPAAAIITASRTLREGWCQGNAAWRWISGSNGNGLASSYLAAWDQAANTFKRC